LLALRDSNSKYLPCWNVHSKARGRQHRRDREEHKRINRMHNRKGRGGGRRELA
jgi:hypothetical protein